MIRRYTREISVAAAYVVLLLLLYAQQRFTGQQAFFNGGNLLDLLVTMSPVLVMGVGMTLVILARHIDISVGWQFSLCGLVAALMAQAGVSMIVVVPATVLLGCALGALNAAFVVGLNLPSIVVTLATMVIYRESIRWLRRGEAVRSLTHGFQWFGASQEAGQWIVIGSAVAIFVLFAIGLRYLAAGRGVYATGSDQEAARLAGIRPRRVVCGVFVVMGGLSGLAALLNAIRFPDVYPNLGADRELQVIAAVVVGGVAISGGRGTLLGVLVGVALLVTLRPALTTIGLPAEWEKALQGLIILLAVATDALGRRR